MAETKKVSSVEITFEFLSGEVALRGLVCSDATVGTFNSMPRSSGFRIPEGSGYSCAHDERFKLASDSETAIYGEISPNENGKEVWTIILSGDHRPRVLNLSEAGEMLS